MRPSLYIQKIISFTFFSITMAQYIPFEASVEVNGNTISSFISAVPDFTDIMLEVLSRHGIDHLQADQWYSQAAWLNAFREIGEEFGESTLFSIGLSIPENAQFPPELDSLEKALAGIDIAYHMNHRNGEIGYYRLVEFDPDTHTAMMECRNPYPSHFDRGIITAMVRKFKPLTSINISVELDTDKPSRLQGADSCTYRITW
jgi:hypothetical protein